jgi:hypothetical protein
MQPRDRNFVPVLGAVTNDANLTPTAIKVNSSTNGVMIDETLYTTNTSFDHGRKSSIGASAVALTATSFDCKLGGILVAYDANPGNVFAGNSDVTADSTDATDGIIIEMGRHIEIAIDDPVNIYLIADSGTTNKIYYIAI